MSWPGHTNNQAGRPKGTLNRKTKDLFEKAEELGVDPFEVLLLFAKGDWKALGYDEFTAKQVGEIVIMERTITPEARLKAAEKACEYLYSKKKSIEIKDDEGKGFVIKMAYPEK